MTELPSPWASEFWKQQESGLSERARAQIIPIMLL